jgi:hypothetical protein
LEKLVTTVSTCPLLPSWQFVFGIARELVREMAASDRPRNQPFSESGFIELALH